MPHVLCQQGTADRNETPHTPVGTAAVRTLTPPHATRTWSHRTLVAAVGVLLVRPLWETARRLHAKANALGLRCRSHTAALYPKESSTYATRNLRTDVCSSFIHTRPNLEAAETPLVGDGQNGPCRQRNVTSLSDKNEPPSHKMTWGKRKCRLTGRSQREEATEGVIPTRGHLEKVRRP